MNKELILGKWVYSIQYKPNEYIALFENKNATSLNELSERINGLSGTVWFNISFGLQSHEVSPMRYNLATPDEYDRRVDYYLNAAQKDIKLIYDNKDTLERIAYAFENNYNLTPFETIVIGFKLPGHSEKPQKEMKLCFNDRIFDNGILKVVYKQEEINNTPKLIF